MILLCLLIAADSGDAIAELKAQERSLLDTIDDLVADRRKLDKRLVAVQSELESIRAMVEGQKQRLQEDARVHEVAAREARLRARSLSRVMRGQGARFVVGADGFADGLRRMQLLQRVLRRDWIVLSRALDAVEAQAERLAAVQANQTYANEVTESLAALKLEILAKTRTLNDTLAQVRLQRAKDERSFYDLKELEAVLKREEEEEKIAATDPFGELKGRLRWPVHGRINRPFGTYQDARFGLDLARSGVGIAAAQGTLMMSVHAGTVRYVDPIAGYGRVVIVQHSENYFAVYGGLGEARATRGQSVKEGDVVGVVGGANAYFELRRRSTPEDPVAWLQQ